MFNFCNAFDLLTSRTQNIAWRPPVFKPEFHIFPYNEQPLKIFKFLMYHISLRQVY